MCFLYVVILWSPSTSTSMTQRKKLRRLNSVFYFIHLWKQKCSSWVFGIRIVYSKLKIGQYNYTYMGAPMLRWIPVLPYTFRTQPSRSRSHKLSWKARYNYESSRLMNSICEACLCVPSRLYSFTKCLLIRETYALSRDVRVWLCASSRCET